MEPTIENIVKALKACADAHKVEFVDVSQDPDEYPQAYLKSDTVPVVADVRTICEAFYGHSRMVDTDFGCTTVYFTDFCFAPAVNETLLAMALPHGTKL